MNNKYIAIPEELIKSLSEVFLTESNELTGYVTFIKTINGNEQVFKIQKIKPELGDLLITSKETPNSIPVYMHVRKAGETVQARDVTLNEKEEREIKKSRHGLALLIRPLRKLVNNEMPKDINAIDFQSVNYDNEHIALRAIYFMNKQGNLY